ncbi:uncharacterized protein LOC122805302 [Protopterus annectens]|uniref:uncharacterized protein LOC122805302 n=1 Tax=Protopterus annectens TaxID=7888 RepID=UPI001CFA5F0F|nr:uncharacterized protein LOC122805302 [Protopterus annectens]
MADKSKGMTGFKQCHDCGRKMPNSDGHSSCVYCLGPVHLQEDYDICQAFSHRALIERKNKLILTGLIKTSFDETLSSQPRTSKSDVSSPSSFSSISSKVELGKKRSLSVVVSPLAPALKRSKFSVPTHSTEPKKVEERSGRNSGQPRRGPQSTTDTESAPKEHGQADKPEVHPRGVEDISQQTALPAGCRMVWIVGQSFIYWAERRAQNQPSGKQLGLCTDRWKLQWRGIRNMCWPQLQSELDNMSESLTKPDVLILHLGGNDLGCIPKKEFVEVMLRDISLLKEKYPGIVIVWSIIIARLVWKNALSFQGMEKARKYINKMMCREATILDFRVLQHTEFENRDPSWFRPDGMHLNDAGLDLFNLHLRSFLQGLE